jgi:ABC-type Fe3+ transport system substrate-binding protein
MKPMPPLTITSRRRALATLAGLAAASALGGARAQSRRPVVVLTAYPEEVTSRFEAAFEKAYPQFRLQLVWRMPFDALPYLQAPRQSGVDIYWSASPRTYAALKQAGALRRLEIDRDGLPSRIGGTDISDRDGQFLATEVAGYGFAYQPQRLAALGLALPADWPDLARPGWAGQIALPVPARVGFAPVMVDIVLQAFGWQRGWALWSAIAANAALVDNGSTFITDEVASGRRALGLTIDFFAASAAARGAPLRFAYPAHGGINPGHIAVLSQSPEPEGALAFTRFVLSDEGQAILGHPSVRKLPVRPSAYARLPADYFNPFAASAQGGYDYDNARGLPRLGLISALFEQALVADHAEYAALWQRLHAAEAAGRPVAAARALLEAPPIDAAAADDPALARRFRRLEGSNPEATGEIEPVWRAAAAQRRQQAAALLV